MDRGRGRIRILAPGGGIPFAGHPMLGTAWVLRAAGLRRSGHDVVQARGAGEIGVHFDGADFPRPDPRPAGHPGLSSRLDLRTLVLLGVGVGAVSLSAPVMASLVVAPLAISFWRNAMATGVLAPVAIVGHRTGVGAMSASSLGLVVLAGLCLAAHFGFWVTSLTMTSVASSTAIVCLAVIWVVGYDFLRGAPVGRQVLIGVLVATAGALVVTGVDFSISTRALVGDLFALVGSMAVAAYRIIGGRARQRVDTTAYTFTCYGTAALALLVACLVTGQHLFGYDAHQWLLLALVAGSAQLLGHSLFNHLLARVSPMVVSLTLLLEVPGASVIAAAWLHQVPGWTALLGLTLILAGMAVVVLAAPRVVADAPVE